MLRFRNSKTFASVRALLRSPATARSTLPASSSCLVAARYTSSSSDATATGTPSNSRADFAYNHFIHRHVGPRLKGDTAKMLDVVGEPSLEAMMKKVVPQNILLKSFPQKPPMTEAEVLSYFRRLMAKNKSEYKSLIGQGYYEACVPAAIQRNVLENPQWYTPYTPYQAEISQGRLESLLNFQTAVIDLTGLPVANASLLDEACAAMESVVIAVEHHRTRRTKRRKVLVDSRCFTTTLEMIKHRSSSLDIELVFTEVTTETVTNEYCAVVVQSPDARGQLHDFTDVAKKAKANQVLTCMGTDLMACTLVKSPGEMGADIAFGTAQRLGVPLGYGGPHPAFFAVSKALTRMIPGRIIAVSKDADGQRALRMALQTREQHIKREHALSNICTAQALLANMAAMFCVYHGPEGLRRIATDIHTRAKLFATGVELAGHKVVNKDFFDTITVELDSARMSASDFAEHCEQHKVNVWPLDDKRVSISFDEATRTRHLEILFAAAGVLEPDLKQIEKLSQHNPIPETLRRQSPYMQDPVFNSHHDETSLMRYCHKLARNDYGLQNGMVPLGSCTMKLNPAATMLPLSWQTVGGLHPLVPNNQAEGYAALALALSEQLKAVSGLDAVSLQPNSGAQGEYAGLRCILAYLKAKGQGHRKLCLSPANAHGTNPASAVLAGLKPMVVKCLADGTIDLVHLESLVKKHGDNIAAIQITYPSTYGIYDEGILKITEMIHGCGGQVYIDGANFNAMNGYTGPGAFGGDVCHFNLHKTFCIPHGGGGPGVGPIAVKDHLAPYLPGHPISPNPNKGGPIAQANLGSASILSISHIIISMLGSDGLRRSTEGAILSANYLAKRLENDYNILFRTETRPYCAHEFILDARPFKADEKIGIGAEDIAKRLLDYGFHAPTLAFPLKDTLMIEPTESEPLAELDRFVDALRSIRQEIRDIETGKYTKESNPLVNAPHPLKRVVSDTWDAPYSRQLAGLPGKGQTPEKLWPSVSRLNQEFGDQNFFCSCGPTPWEK